MPDNRYARSADGVHIAYEVPGDGPIDGKVGDIAVNIGASVGGVARPSEVLVSWTVKDLVAGSGLVVQDKR